MKPGATLGRIKVIPGDNAGRFPFCNSLWIDDEVQVIVDPGAGLYKLQAINNAHRIDLVLNTHVHFDHIVYNYLFDQAKIMVNQPESIYFHDRRAFLQATSVVDALGEGWVTNWIAAIKQPDYPQSPYTPAYRHEWQLSLARLDGTYTGEDSFDFGHVKMEIIPAPGHSPGYCVLYFPDEGVVYCGDIDLTKYGPWCYNSDQFIISARRVAELNADTFVTGHEEGVVTKAEFNDRLDEYLGIIYQRDTKLLNALNRPMSFKEIVQKGLFYGPRIFADDFLYCWEWAMDKEHINRLVDQDLVVRNQDKYFRA